MFCCCCFLFCFCLEVPDTVPSPKLFGLVANLEVGGGRVVGAFAGSRESSVLFPFS